jgi:tRNA (cmo5U34)-methyltransferase
LHGQGKRDLFTMVHDCISARGCLLIADLVLPQREEARELFEATWDHSAEERSRAQTGDAALFDLFVREHWNYYRYPDPFDQPSPLFNQLLWLKEAGFAVVDCFWMQAGHAIYGGYREQAGATEGHPIDYETALEIASRALGSQSN